MKIRLVLPSSMEAKITQEGEQFAYLIEPTFYSPNEFPVVGFLEVLDLADNVTQRAILQVSGRTAQLRLIDRSQPVCPQYDSQVAADGEPIKKKKKIKPPVQEPQSESSPS